MTFSATYTKSDPGAASNGTTQRFGQGRAFLIGVEHYDYVTPLDTPRSDVEKLATVLADKHGFEVHTLLKKEAGKEITKSELEHFLFKTLPDSVQPDDRVILYFAGHGIAVTEENPTEPKGFLLTGEARGGNEDTYFPMSRLNEALHNLQCKHLLLLLDCCFAGAFQWTLRARSIGAIPHKIYRQRFYDVLCKQPAWQAIASTVYNQKALDSLHRLGDRPVGENRHSPFAWALIRALEDGDADTTPKGGDGLITVSELFSYLQEYLIKLPNGQAQKPAFFTLSKHQQGEFFFVHPVVKKITLEDYDEKENPYCGLEAYGYSQKDNFYGRDKAVELLCDNVETKQMVVVVGASGSGKSSVAKAGVLPRLVEKGYDIADIRPGAKPVAALEAVIAGMRKTKGSEKALLIDQFEELVTLCSNQQERDEFYRHLLELVKTHKIIITVRSDFEIFFKKSTLMDLWEKGRYELKNLDARELRQIVKMPAIARSIQIEEDVVEELVQSTLNKPAALPLLAYTLTELHDGFIRRWELDHQTSREITRADYESVGRIDGVLETKAGEIWDALDEPGRQTLVNIMMRMVTLGETGELVKSAVTEKDLAFDDADIDTRVKDVIGKLTGNRLVVSFREGCYEPAHDALVRVWENRYDWRKEIGPGNLHLLEHLTDSVNRYQDNGRRKTYLWTFNPNYAKVRTAFNAFSQLRLNKRQQDFIYASRENRLQFWLSVASFIVLLIFVGLQFAEEGLMDEQSKKIAERKTEIEKWEKIQANKKADRSWVETLFKTIDAQFEYAKTQMGEEKYEEAIGSLREAERNTQQESLVKKASVFGLSDSLQTRAAMIERTIAECEEQKIIKIQYDGLMNQARIVEARGPAYYYMAMRLYQQAKNLGYISKINPVQKNIDYMDDLLAKTFNEFMEDAEARWKANRPDLACQRLHDADNITKVSDKTDKSFLKKHKEKYACQGF